MGGKAFTCEIEGGTPDATIMPGMMVMDFVTLKLKDVSISGSLSCSTDAEGRALNPLTVRPDADVEAINVKVLAGDERPNPAHNAFVWEDAKVRFQDCELMSTYRDGAITCRPGVRLHMERTKVAGLYMEEGGNFYSHDCVIQGIPGISTIGVWILRPVRLVLTSTTVENFSGGGVSLVFTTEPSTFVVQGNIIRKCTRGFEVAGEVYRNRQKLLQNNRVSEISDEKAFQLSDACDVLMTRTAVQTLKPFFNDVRANSVEGMYCEGALKLVMESGGASVSLKVLDAKGAVVGKGTLPHHSGPEMILFLFGDAATLKDGRALLWSNGDLWPKYAPTAKTKVSTKELTKRAEQLIKSRKVAGKAREACNGRMTGPEPEQTIEDSADEHMSRIPGAGGPTGPTRATGPVSPKTKAKKAPAPDVPGPGPEQTPKPDVKLKQCVICCESEDVRKISWIFEECGHRCLCKPCARKLRASTKLEKVECPVCRTVSRILPAKFFSGEKMFE